jgi:hypothetical protein
MASFDVQEDAFDSAKSAILHAHRLANFEKRPGLLLDISSHHSSNSCDLSVVDGNRSLTETHDLDDPGSYEYWKAIHGIEPAKQISRKQRKLNLFDAVRPPAAGLVNRQKGLVALAIQLLRHVILVPEFRVKREPRMAEGV